MIKNAYCLAVDLINADKPPASLAFLAGACEQTNTNYETSSLNVELLHALDTEQYNKVYAFLKLKKTHQWKPILDPIIDQLMVKIINYHPQTVLVTVFSFLQAPLAQEIFARLKSSSYQGEIVVGGPGVSSANMNGKTNGRTWLEQGLIDYYCLGEGDEVLVQYLQGKKHILGFNGKKSLSETWVPQLSDLDQSMVIPSYRKVPTAAYHNLEQKSSPIFSITTSRGCVRRCTFCDIRKTWAKFRFRSGAHVASEILKHHQDVGAVHFTIVDSLINGSLKSFREFNQEMIRLKQQHKSLANFSYNGMFIVRDSRSHPESLFQQMKGAGCETLAIGVETGSDRLRAEMDKKFTLQDLDHHLSMCQKYEIRNTFLMFVGYPTETDDDFEQTLTMLHRYQKYLIDDTIIGINHSGVFGMLPDTPIFLHREQMNIDVFEDAENLSLSWFNNNNPDLTIKKRILRDLEFRKRALELRYPIPYATRYLEYLKEIDKFSDLVPD